jgi:transcription elongation factor Elf1
MDVDRLACYVCGRCDESTFFIYVDKVTNIVQTTICSNCGQLMLAKNIIKVNVEVNEH